MTSFHDAAAKQQGYLDGAQAKAAGLSQKQIDKLVEKRLWQRPHPGVYRTGSAPPHWEDRVRAACLAAGGASRAMGRTAGRLYGLDAHEHHTIIELTVPMTHGPVPKGVIVRRTRRLDPSLASTIRGIPVSAINQTLLELTWLVRADPPIERAVEDAFRRLDTDEGPLRRFLAHCGKGVEGVTRLRTVLDKRPEGRPARSGFEVIVLDILREGGLPLPLRRPLVSIPPDIKYELDLAYVLERIDIEPMGAKWHATATQRRADAERRKILKALGWIVVEVTWDDAIHAPQSVVARVCEALVARGRRF